MSRAKKPRSYSEAAPEHFTRSETIPMQSRWLFKQRFSYRALLAVGMALALTAGFALAQDCPSQRYKRSSQTPIVRDMVNPSPFEDEFELPLPCGGKLILRHVCIPAGSFLDDLQFNLGCEDCRRRDEGFMETKRMAELAGAFTLEDLPEPWQLKLLAVSRGEDGRCTGADEQNLNGLYYFIGKYEITNWQWQTVMNDDCPGWEKPFSTEDPRPITNISWFEAVEFTRRYTEWLLKNKPESLPKFPDGRYAYIRLPTEAEWEYAARGGHMITSSEMDQAEFFPLNNLDFSDYAVYTQAGAAKPPERLAWIGTKCPNPLGLFDTAGNAAEMMMDPFRFSLGSRLHGATGGFIIKGGSYLKSRAEIMPGRREEMPFFLDDGAFRSSDLGLRVVLSGIVTPQNRSKILRGQWTKISTKNRLFQPESEAFMPAMELDQGSRLISEIEGLAAAATTDAEKQKLLAAAEYIKNTSSAIADQETDSIEALIWKALFAEESLLEYTSQCSQLRNEQEMLKKLKTEPIPETDIESLISNISKLTEQISHCDAAMNYLVQAYLTSIRDSQKFSKDAVDHQLNLIIQNQNLDEAFRSSLTGRLEVFRDHISLFNNNPEDIQPQIIIRDIVSRLER